MDTKSLEYFIALYRCKNMHKAAEDLFLTQQGLSRAVTRLEKEFDVQLFERGPYGVYPTKAGDRFYEYALQQLAALGEIRRELKSISQGKERLRIACSYGVLHILYPHIQAFIRAHPEVEVCVTERTDQETDECLADGSAQIGFCVAGKGQEAFAACPVFQGQVVLLVYEGHPFWDRKSVLLSELKGEKIIIVGEKFHLYSMFRDKCLEQGFLPDIAVGAAEISLCHSLCRMKEGLAVTVDFLLERGTEGVRAVPFSEEGLSWNVVMAVQKDHKMTEGMKLFRSFITKRLKCC